MSARFSRRSLLAAAGLMAGGLPVRAAEDFYRGKVLTLIVGFAPGGGIDTAGRIMARHIARFLPGTPSVVVQNMEGASGVLAANYLDRKVAPDGLTIAVPGRSWHVEGLIRSPGVQYDVTRLGYVGSTGTMNSLLWVRADTGLTSFEDLRRAQQPVVFGALGAGSPTAMIPALLAANGVPIKLVIGYTATSRLLIAMEQGEVPAAFLTEDAFATHQSLIERGLVRAILQSKPDVPGLPLVRDMVSEQQRPILDLARSAESLGLMVVAPPAVPPERLQLLRAAFLAMARDPEYQADVARFETTRTLPLSGEEVTRLIASLAAGATPEVIAAYKRLKS